MKRKRDDEPQKQLEKLILWLKQKQLLQLWHSFVMIPGISRHFQAFPGISRQPNGQQIHQRPPTCQHFLRPDLAGEGVGARRTGFSWVATCHVGTLL